MRRKEMVEGLLNILIRFSWLGFAFFVFVMPVLFTPSPFLKSVLTLNAFGSKIGFG